MKIVIVYSGALLGNLKQEGRHYLNVMAEFRKSLENGTFSKNEPRFQRNEIIFLNPEEVLAEWLKKPFEKVIFFGIHYVSGRVRNTCPSIMIRQIVMQSCNISERDWAMVAILCTDNKPLWSGGTNEQNHFGFASTEKVNLWEDIFDWLQIE